MKKCLLFLFSMFVLISCGEDTSESDVFLKKKECLDLDWKKFVTIGTYTCGGFDGGDPVLCKIEENDITLENGNGIFYSKKLNSCLLGYHYKYSHSINDITAIDENGNRVNTEWEENENEQYYIKDILNGKDIFYSTNSNIYSDKINELDDSRN